MRHERSPIARARGLRTALVVLGLLWAHQAHASERAQVAERSVRPNVLVIVADDLGIDGLSVYQPLANCRPPHGPSLQDPPVPWGVGLDAIASTPNIDALAATGIVFESAWSNPTCSPTRATLLTGRYAGRTGIGEALLPGYTNPVAACEPSIAQYVAPEYATGLFGKWHLGDDPCAPCTRFGWDEFAGSVQNQDSPGQCAPSWVYKKCPAAECEGPPPSAGYVDTAFADALDFIQRQGSQPWLCYLWPQYPFEWVQGPDCSSCQSGAPACFVSLVADFDARIGTFLGAIDPAVFANTTILFVGDNGPPSGRELWPPGPAPFSGQIKPRHKGSLYNAGIHVPFIVSGASVTSGQQGTRSCELVNTTDLFATIVSLTGGSLPAIELDSNDLAPLLTGAPGFRSRSFIFAERFNATEPSTGCTRTTFPCGFQQIADHDGAIRNLQYKLIRFRFLNLCTEEFYDLTRDFTEQNDLLATGLTAWEQKNYDRLRKELDRRVERCFCR